MKLRHLVPGAVHRVSYPHRWLPVLSIRTECRWKQQNIPMDAIRLDGVLNS